MNQLDQRIREALAAEDQELFGDATEEQSIFQLIGESFQGKQRWLVCLVYFMTTVCSVFFFFCGYRFWTATSDLEQMRYGFFSLALLFAISAYKMWYWMELTRITLVREVKRVELQLALLSARLKENR